MAKKDPFECEHKRLYDYEERIYCSIEFCDGGWENHCRDCGYFVAECSCGACTGISGWSYKRWEKWWDKRRKKREASREVS